MNIPQKIVDLIRSNFKRTTNSVAGLREPSALEDIEYKRFLTNSPVVYDHAIDAAQSYASKLDVDAHEWLYSKPFDPTPGNAQFYRLMFDLLNILQAMKLPSNAKILEVGSGPGWVTEILLMLGYSVDALEPSAALIEIARERCASLKLHYHHQANLNVRFHQSTLEKVELENESFDAILFFDVLHHVVDENIAIEKSFRFLRPDGCLGVVDPSWHPDFKNLEQQMIGEMEKYGTLENPFSTEYIDFLLRQSGFTRIERYVSVNGMFSKKQMGKPIQDFSHMPYEGSNNLTARKPSGDDPRFPNVADRETKTSAQLKLVSGGIDAASRTAVLVVHVKNTGETLFDCRPARHGCINFGLRNGAPGSPQFIECLGRQPLSEMLPPGATRIVELRFTLPEDASLENWMLDLVSEGVFWFSSIGVPSCPIPLH